MRLRRQSPSNEQAKRLKLMTALIGGLETALTFDLEEHERQYLLETQDTFKHLLCYWAGVESANIKKDAFVADRKAAVNPESDRKFTPKPSGRPNKRGPLSPEHRAKISAANKARAAAKQPKLLPAPAQPEAMVQ
jgi:hypothetical protein